jgi:hypothetical protein
LLSCATHHPLPTFVYRTYTQRPSTSLNTQALGTRALSERTSSAWISSPTFVSQNTLTGSLPASACPTGNYIVSPLSCLADAAANAVPLVSLLPPTPPPSSPSSRHDRMPRACHYSKLTRREHAALKTAPSHRVAFAEHTHQIASSSLLWTSPDRALPAAAVPVPAEGTGKRKQHRPPTPSLTQTCDKSPGFDADVEFLPVEEALCASPSLFPSPQTSGHTLQTTPKSADNSKSTPCRATSPTPTLTPPVPVTYN